MDCVTGEFFSWTFWNTFDDAYGKRDEREIEKRLSLQREKGGMRHSFAESVGTPRVSDRRRRCRRRRRRFFHADDSLEKGGRKRKSYVSPVDFDWVFNVSVSTKM